MIFLKTVKIYNSNENYFDIFMHLLHKLFFKIKRRKKLEI